MTAPRLRLAPLLLALGMTLAACTSSPGPPASPGPAQPAIADQSTCPAQAGMPRPGQLQGSASVIVPGKPVALLACGYRARGGTQPRQPLASSAEPPNLGAIAADLNAGGTPFRGSPCPVFRPTEILLRFAYANGSGLWVRVDPLCFTATNGAKAAQADLAVVSELNFLLHLAGQFHPPYEMRVFASQPCSGRPGIGPGAFRPLHSVTVRVAAPGGIVIGMASMPVTQVARVGSPEPAQCVAAATVNGLPKENSYRVTVEGVDAQREETLQQLQWGGWRVSLSVGVGTPLVQPRSTT